MARSKNGSVHIGVDARELTALYRDLHDAEPALAKQFIVDMKAAAEPIKDEAVAAASTFSERIPPTIRVVAQAGSRGKVKIAIRAGGPGLAIAPLEELGSTGNPGTIRHPTPAGARKAREDRTAADWVEQPAHPYLLPALRRNLEAVAEKVAAGADAALKRLRL